jgi:hypothetical protein
MKRFFLVSLFLGLCSYASAWTSTQVTKSANCTAATCTDTVTSTGAHHALGVSLIGNSTGITISSVTAGFCNTTWTHAPATNTSNASTGSVDSYYCTDSVAGQTSLVVGQTGGGGNTYFVVFFEATPTLSTVAFDTGTTPSSGGTSSSSTAPPGTTLNLSANSHYVFGVSACQNSCNSTNFSGTGCVNDLANPSGDTVFHCISSTSGSQAYPATFSQSPAGVVSENAAAFQETSGGGGSTFVPQIGGFLVGP